MKVNDSLRTDLNDVEVLFMMSSFEVAFLHFHFSTAPLCSPDNCQLR